MVRPEPAASLASRPIADPEARVRRTALPALAVALLLAACGGGGDGDAGGSSPSPAQDLGQKPMVEIPGGDPPGELVVETLVEGQGAEAGTGDSLTVHYVGVAWSTGQEFDSSWSRSQPFRFELGGDVIEGWNQGLAGMRVGERRRLVIPPELAYGEQGAGGGVIGPNETLVFVVDLLDISR